MNKIIVTGVCGQIGLAIADLLTEAGNYVIGLDVRSDGKTSQTDLFEFHQNGEYLKHKKFTDS